MDRSMRGDDEIAVLTKHNSCKGLYTGMVRGCLQTLLIIFLVWQEYDWATEPCGRNSCLVSQSSRMS